MSACTERLRLYTIITCVRLVWTAQCLSSRRSSAQRCSGPADEAMLGQYSPLPWHAMECMEESGHDWLNKHAELAREISRDVQSWAKQIHTKTSRRPFWTRSCVHCSSSARERSSAWKAAGTTAQISMQSWHVTSSGRSSACWRGATLRRSSACWHARPTPSAHLTHRAARLWCVLRGRLLTKSCRAACRFPLPMHAYGKAPNTRDVRRTSGALLLGRYVILQIAVLQCGVHSEHAPDAHQRHSAPLRHPP